MIAICYTIHPQLPIKATLHKWSDKDEYIPLVEKHFTEVTKRLREAGLDNIADEYRYIELPDTERDELQKAIDCTGYIWTIHEKICRFLNDNEGDQIKPAKISLH